MSYVFVLPRFAWMDPLSIGSTCGRSEDDASWNSFKEALLRCYGGAFVENPFENLAELQQRGPVDDFIEEFEFYAS